MVGRKKNKQKPDKANQLSHRSYDIFVVDDNFDQANIIKLLMEQYGFSTEFTTNSKNAFLSIMKNKPRLVILDLMMPEIDGLRLCKMIKDNPVTADVKIVIYSGKLYDSDRRKAKMLGADLFLTKPTRSQVLVDSIRNLLATGKHDILPN